MSETNTTNEIKELAAVILMFMLIGFGLPLAVIFIPQIGGIENIGEQDFEIQTTSLVIYGIFALIGIVGLTSLKVREILRKGKPGGILDYAILHDYDQDSLLGKIKFLPEGLKKVFRSPLKMYVIAVIIFAIFGLYQVQSNTFLSKGNAIISQQLSPIGSSVLGMEPPAAAENLFFSVILCLLYGFLRGMQRKLRFGEFIFWILAIIFIPTAIALLWMGYHGLVYGGQEVALTATFVFAWVGSFLTLIFGTLLIWWAWHQMNNLFFELNGFSNDTVFLITILILVVIGIMFGLFIYLTRKQKIPIEQTVA